MSEIETTTGEQPVKKSKAEKLAEAKLLIKHQADRIAELEKKIESVTKDKDRYYEWRLESERKLEEMHVLFDGLPGCVGRKTSDDYNGKEFSLSARFASWLAGRCQS